MPKFQQSKGINARRDDALYKYQLPFIRNKKELEKC